MTRKEQINSFTTDKLLELGPAFSENGIQYNNGYIRGLIEGAEWADEHPVNYDGKAMLHILEKGVKQGKRELIDKVCEWVKKHHVEYAHNSMGSEYIVSDLRKAMEE